MRSILPFLAALLLPAALHAQANASATLVTYGDVLGASGQAVASGLTPSTTTYILPSTRNTGSNYLVGLSGDPNDFLTVDIDLAAQGTYFQGTSDTSGVYTANYLLPNNPAYLDMPVYWQGFTFHGGTGAGMFQDFTNLRVMTLNQSDRWQPTLQVAPVAAANLAWTVTGWDRNGNPTELFLCGGGPALLTDATTPYPTIDQAWRYDALRDEYTLLPGTMNTSRAFHTATRLLDGRILVAGGVTFGGQSGSNYYTNILNSAEVYDPVTGTWTPTGPMTRYRAGHTASLLPDGRVLVAGGTQGNNQHQLFDIFDILGTALANSEIYDPATNSWSSGPVMHEPKAGHVAVQLLDGRIAMMGGITHTVIIGVPVPDFSDVISIYDPAANSFNARDFMRAKRALFGAAVLPDGKVFIAGGAGGDIFNIGPIKRTELYDPTTGSSTNMPDLPSAVAFSRVVVPGPGLAVVVGGATGSIDDPDPVADVSLFDETAGTITPLTPMLVPHGGGAVELLADGTVLATGGETFPSGAATDASETYSQ